MHHERMPIQYDKDASRVAMCCTRIITMMLGKFCLFLIGIVSAAQGQTPLTKKCTDVGVHVVGRYSADSLKGVQTLFEVLPRIWSPNSHGYDAIFVEFDESFDDKDLPKAESIQVRSKYKNKRLKFSVEPTNTDRQFEVVKAGKMFPGETEIPGEIQITVELNHQKICVERIKINEMD